LRQLLLLKHLCRSNSLSLLAEVELGVMVKVVVVQADTTTQHLEKQTVEANL
jgi:hypothetical protein